ncbi:hypothetical protein K503DRAFT_415408 [Rhizopogon vinicolor AM-OR11-026]|uniref:Uncharacterized protein n=1 Tax=Rhizopogon vinicolor AM-OR11-026 TaxID=1314800 RepID=A0A1B7NAZ2_9AGAM|nr:hypothetical protein K503DRAFT_415408 [Rhizopogon vinicolor AM-OR11-026]
MVIRDWWRTQMEVNTVSFYENRCNQGIVERWFNDGFNIQIGARTTHPDAHSAGFRTPSFAIPVSESVDFHRLLLASVVRTADMYFLRKLSQAQHI